MKFYITALMSRTNLLSDYCHYSFTAENASAAVLQFKAFCHGMFYDNAFTGGEIVSLSVKPTRGITYEVVT